MLTTAIFISVEIIALKALDVKKLSPFFPGLLHFLSLKLRYRFSPMTLIFLTSITGGEGSCDYYYKGVV